MSTGSAIRFVRQAKELGHVGLKKPKKRESKLDPFTAVIMGRIGERPDLTLAGLCARLDEDHGLRVGSLTLDDWLCVNQATFKKNGTRR